MRVIGRAIPGCRIYGSHPVGIDGRCITCGMQVTQWNAPTSERTPGAFDSVAPGDGVE